MFQRQNKREVLKGHGSAWSGSKLYGQVRVMVTRGDLGNWGFVVAEKN